MADQTLVQGAGLVAQSRGVGDLAASQAWTKAASHLSEGLGDLFQKRNREFNKIMEAQLNKEGLTDAEYDKLYERFKERRGAYVYLNKKDRALAMRDLMKDADNIKNKEDSLDDISETITNEDNQITINDLGALTEDLKDITEGNIDALVDEHGRVGYSLSSDALKDFVVEGENGENKLLGYIGAWNDKSRWEFYEVDGVKMKKDEFGNEYPVGPEGRKEFVRESKLFWIRQAREDGNKLLHYNSTTGKREYLTPDEAEALLNDEDQFVTLDEIKDHIKGKAVSLETYNQVNSLVLNYKNKGAETDAGEFNWDQAYPEFEKIVDGSNLYTLANKKYIGNTSWREDALQKLKSMDYGDIKQEWKNLDPTQGDNKITSDDANHIVNKLMDDEDMLKKELTHYLTSYAKQNYENQIDPEKKGDKSGGDKGGGTGGGEGGEGGAGGEGGEGGAGGEGGGNTGGNTDDSGEMYGAITSMKGSDGEAINFNPPGNTGDNDGYKHGQQVFSAAKNAGGEEITTTYNNGVIETYNHTGTWDTGDGRDIYRVKGDYTSTGQGTSDGYVDDDWNEFHLDENTSTFYEIQYTSPNPGLGGGDSFYNVKNSKGEDEKVFLKVDGVTESKSGVDRDLNLAREYRDGNKNFPSPSVGVFWQKALMNADRKTMVENWDNAYGEWGFSFEVLTDKNTPRHYVNKFSDSTPNYPKTSYSTKQSGMQREAITITAPNGKKESFALDHWSKGDDIIMSGMIKKWMEQNLGITKPKKEEVVIDEDNEFM